MVSEKKIHHRWIRNIRITVANGDGSGVALTHVAELENRHRFTCKVFHVCMHWRSYQLVLVATRRPIIVATQICLFREINVDIDQYRTAGCMKVAGQGSCCSK